MKQNNGGNIKKFVVVAAALSAVAARADYTAPAAYASAVSSVTDAFTYASGSAFVPLFAGMTGLLLVARLVKKGLRG